MYYPPAFTHAQPPSPIINIPRQSGTFLTVDEPLCYIIITQSPQSILGFTLGVARSVGLDTIQ